MHGVFQRELLAVAHPVAQQVRLQRRIHDLGDVRPAVRERRDGPRVLQQVQHQVLVLVRQSLHEEHLEVAVEREIHERLHRRHPALGCDHVHRAERRQRLCERIDVRPDGLASLRPERPPVVAVLGLVHQASPNLGVSKLRPLLAP